MKLKKLHMLYKYTLKIIAQLYNIQFNSKYQKIMSI